MRHAPSGGATPTKRRVMASVSGISTEDPRTIPAALDMTCREFRWGRQAVGCGSDAPALIGAASSLTRRLRGRWFGEPVPLPPVIAMPANGAEAAIDALLTRFMRARGCGLTPRRRSGAHVRPVSARRAVSGASEKRKNPARERGRTPRTRARCIVRSERALSLFVPSARTATAIALRGAMAARPEGRTSRRLQTTPRRIKRPSMAAASSTCRQTRPDCGGFVAIGHAPATARRTAMQGRPMPPRLERRSQR